MKEDSAQQGRELLTQWHDESGGSCSHPSCLCPLCPSTPGLKAFQGLGISGKAPNLNI